MLGLKAILSFNGPASHETPEVSLHDKRCILLVLLWIEVVALTTNPLRLLRIQLCILGLTPAACLSHYFIIFLSYNLFN